MKLKHQNSLNYNKILVLIIVLQITICNTISSQNFASQIGFEGSTAIHKDSSIFVNWACECVVNRGFIDIADTTKTHFGTNKASFGNDTLAIGKADGVLNVVSLGDGGIATLTFSNPITNEDGWDFAVFENGFIEPTNPELAFLELAFVEVSSDGENFFRFPCVSNISVENQIRTFDKINTNQINNLAGKYPSNYGTPFDLEDLREFENQINLNNITHLKLIDVVGTINSDFANFDMNGNIINDPYPTAFASGGFDLDAVGVINQKIISENPNQVLIYPNPSKNYLNIESSYNFYEIKIYDFYGNLMLNFSDIKTTHIEISTLPQGMYFIGLVSEKKVFKEKFVKLNY